MLPSPVRSAIDVRKAIESAPQTLQAIGTCITAADGFRRLYTYGDESEQDETARNNLNNKKLVEQLGDIYYTHKVVSHGSVDAFKLTVKRPGCELDGIVTNIYNGGYYNKHIREDGGLLERWHDNAPQAGYGDVRAQETRVDLNIRNAHEIKREEFEVEEGLLEEIAALWGEHFFPAAVRVEPYKINVYGPGGHFKPHKDTPEKDLVGTFLVGLGQTTYAQNLIVAGEGFCAEQLTWVAFYPDVVHEVQPMESGYRAMMAFKVLRLDGTGAEMPADPLRAGGRDVIAPLIEQLSAPFGLLFQRQYGISTTELSGLDAVLLDCARERAAQSGGALEVRVLPVLTHLSGSATMDDYGGSEVDVEANVFPLTDAHVDILVGRAGDEAKGKVAWLESVTDVPFFAIESMASRGEAWRQNRGDDSEYQGNEARAAHEDSIYLSFAMMVLPTNEAQAA